MKKLLFISLTAFTMTFTSCDNKAKMQQEAQEKYEKEAKARAETETKKYHKIEKLVYKASGVTATVKEERSLALLELMEMYPDLEQWEDVQKSIWAQESYDDYRQIVYDIKKLEGWKDTE